MDSRTPSIFCCECNVTGHKMRKPFIPSSIWDECGHNYNVVSNGSGAISHRIAIRDHSRALCHWAAQNYNIYAVNYHYYFTVPIPAVQRRPLISASQSSVSPRLMQFRVCMRASKASSWTTTTTKAVIISQISQAHASSTVGDTHQCAHTQIRVGDFVAVAVAVAATARCTAIECNSLDFACDVFVSYLVWIRVNMKVKETHFG